MIAGLFNPLRRCRDVGGDVVDTLGNWHKRLAAKSKKKKRKKPDRAENHQAPSPWPAERAARPALCLDVPEL